MAADEFAHFVAKCVLLRRVIQVHRGVPGGGDARHRPGNRITGSHPAAKDKRCPQVRQIPGGCGCAPGTIMAIPFVLSPSFESGPTGEEDILNMPDEKALRHLNASL